MPRATRTFRVFVSSTFEDLKPERNALQRYVFPRLRDLCEEGGTRFQAIDLRWGVSAEAGLDQRTIPICLTEIARCQDVSPKPNFVVLLGQRYGWRPLPAEIPADEFDDIFATVSDPDDQAFLTHWYRLDENAVPPLRILRPRTVDRSGATDEERKRAEKEEEQAWQRDEARLRGILGPALDGLGWPPERRTRYEASATEQEIVEGALDADDAEQHVFAFFREIDDLPAKGVETFADPPAPTGQMAPVDRLKDRLRQRLDGNVYEPYGATWTGTGVGDRHIGALPEDLEACKALLDAPPTPPSTLCVDVWCAVGTVIRDQIKELEARDSVDQESDAHWAFAEERAEGFVAERPGRGDLLERIEAHLAGSERHPLGIVGVSGSGKSALMARAALDARERNGRENVIARFIGATPESSDGRSLLETLCRQIHRLLPEGDEASVPSDYRELVAAFPEALALVEQRGRRLIVFIDALDQLSAADGAQSLTWLPAELPPGVRFVVSTLSGAVDEGRAQDPGDPARRSSLQPLRALEAKLPGLEELGPMLPTEGELLLTAWLAGAGRTLQDDQRAEVLSKFGRQGLPLYLKLAFEEARQWRSYDDPRVSLKEEIRGIIEGNLIPRLGAEAHHGRDLVRGALGFLAAAKNGLSEDELVDVLSAEPDVMEAFRRRSPRSPEVDRLPVVVWSRLLLDLEPYLTERVADGASLLAYYHRQVQAVIATADLGGPGIRERHRALADYFSYRRPGDDGITDSPLTLRKMTELPYQQTLGERWDDLLETLTDFYFLERKATDAGVVETRVQTEMRLQGDTMTKPSVTEETHTGIYLLREDFALALERMPGGASETRSRRPLILTAVDEGRGAQVRCPVCGTKWSAPLGAEDACPNCDRAVKVNSFVTDRRPRA